MPDPVQDSTAPKSSSTGKRDPFIIFLALVVIAAWIYPKPGIGTGNWSLSGIAGHAVSLIFFFYGLRISYAQLKTDMANVKLHLLIQLSTFLLFPLVVLAAKPLVPDGSPMLLWTGAFFLAALPSTVSSSVVMVSIAKGNVPAAIFNAGISGVMGVFITPLWINAFVAEGGAAGDPADTIVKLLMQVFFPVVLGLLLNPLWGGIALRYKRQLKIFDQTVILTIVYTSYCKSFHEKVFSNLALTELILLGFFMTALFFLLYSLMSFFSRILKFSEEDKVTAVFCGSKKSLIHGTVLSKVLFQGSNVAGVLLLPLMIYHALQLLFAGILAGRMANRRSNDQKEIKQ